MLTTDHNVEDEVTDEVLDDFFAQALARHQAEDWQVAESFYRKILAVMPRQANVNYNLGMLKRQCNQANASLSYFKTALEVDGSEPKYWVSYIEALLEAGQKNVAIKVLTEGLELGLHGDEVDLLVEQITQTSKTPSIQQTAKPVSHRHQAMVISNAVKHQQTVSKPAATPPKVVKTEAIASHKTLQQYLKNPAVSKVLQLQQTGKNKEAKKQGAALLKHFPKNPVLLTCLGGIALSELRFNEGIQLLEQSLKELPEQTTALSYLCIAYTQLKKCSLAIEYIDQAIELNPNYVDAYINKANALIAFERPDEAVAAYQIALKLQPENRSACVGLGSVLIKLNQNKEAIVYLKQAIKLDKKDAIPHCLCGQSLINLKQYKEAIDYFTTAIALNPNYHEAWFNRGAAYDKLQDYVSACKNFEQAVKLDAENWESHHYLAHTYLKLGQADKALLACENAILLDKTKPSIYSSKGLILTDLRRYEEAFDCFAKAIAIDPNHDEAHWNRALSHLKSGDYTQGWQQYESRWKLSHRDHREPTMSLWLGEQPIKDKTILIYPEQGFGDFIQCSRYVLALEQLGANVILEVEKPLLSLMSTLKAQCTIIESGGMRPDFDYNCPVMSLPLAFKTEIETIPANVPYLFADKNKVARFKQQLGQATQTHVGLVWSGSTIHPNDHHRSIALSHYEPLWTLPVTFHALQKEIRESDKRAVSNAGNLQLHVESLQDFSDTAALIANMDLVITVDTSVAHLAGAMGKDCWLLLPYSGDFRWLDDRLDSPWYPTMTLIRQEKPLDWTSVIERVTVQLQGRFGLI